jgi:hypothetical protein
MSVRMSWFEDGSLRPWTERVLDTEWNPWRARRGACSRWKGATSEPLGTATLASGTGPNFFDEGEQ